MLDTGTIEQAARLAAEAARPKSDHRGSTEYKRHVVYTFVTRALGGREARAA
jgi:carbon-monoxide dehydrogenase medium subunit